MVKLAVVCLNVTDQERAIAFWSAALGYTAHPHAYDVLVPPDGVGPCLALYKTDKTHLDLAPTDGATPQAEIERLTSLGAELVPDWPYPDGADFVVLRDTEGNLFCVLG